MWPGAYLFTAFTGGRLTYRKTRNSANCSLLHSFESALFGTVGVANERSRKDRVSA